ncbi:hypothetical protein, partial [Microbulbifer discodermiae]|uniref:hypothetical protein n=1 Tax=Microbulbifer sp. 2201CG32-9 TaxID=3232309 RepID=UPI00345B8CE1
MRSGYFTVFLLVFFSARAMSAVTLSKERLNNSTIATAVSVFSGAGLNLTKTTLRLFVFSPGIYFSADSRCTG